MLMDRRRMLQQAAVGTAFGICGCRTVPMTGRKQVLLVSEPREIELGLSAYQEILGKEQASRNAANAEMVARVGQRIAKISSRPDYQWEFRLIASPQQNAFALPGGKVAVYEGILPVCENEAGLAVVMSHEVAHALARHGSERMSHQYVVNGVKQVVDYVTTNREQAQREQMIKAYGIASEVGLVLPFSRKHESEADQMGIMMMARAGYDPAEAPRFWTRFGGAKEGQQPPEFLSTHPSDDRRAKDLLALLPEAQRVFDQTANKIGMGQRLI